MTPKSGSVAQLVVYINPECPFRIREVPGSKPGRSSRFCYPFALWSWIVPALSSSSYVRTAYGMYLWAISSHLFLIVNSIQVPTTSPFIYPLIVSLNLCATWERDRVASISVHNWWCLLSESQTACNIFTGNIFQIHVHLIMSSSRFRTFSSCHSVSVKGMRVENCSNFSAGFRTVRAHIFEVFHSISGVATHRYLASSTLLASNVAVTDLNWI